MLVELNIGLAFLHLHLYQWNRAILRECLRGMAEIKVRLKAAGYSKVHTNINDHDPLLYKWQLKMGFRELGRKDGIILMVQPTE